jgi:DNA-binding GntR family transcriptional regulator
VAADELMIVRSPAPIRTQVVDSLRQAILARRFLPGQRLIERELIELTGVSRTSIREALRELAAEGLVTTMPNKGTVVSSLSEKEASELYQLRSALEGLAGRLFVQHATEPQRKALVKALKRIEKSAQNGGEILQAKDDFYSVLFEGAGNDSLRSMANTLHARVRVMRALSLSRPGRTRESVAELNDVVNAVLANDAEAAAKACSVHVEQAARGVLGTPDSEDRLL